MAQAFRLIGKALGFAWDWFARLFIFAMAAMIGITGYYAVVEGMAVLLFLIVPVAAVGMFAPIWPQSTRAVLGWMGRQIAKPYDRWFVPYVAEPLEDRFFPVIGRVFTWGFWAALALIGVLVIALFVFYAWKAVAAIPVSIAVIIGALIIAAAVSARRT